jgi:DNA polymerase-3 subunit gamma/tau
VLNHESAPLAKRLNEQRNTEVVEEALKDALGVGLKVRYEVGSGAEAPAPAAAGAEVTQVQRDEEERMLAEAATTTPTSRGGTPKRPRSSYCRTNWAPRRIDGG